MRTWNGGKEREKEEWEREGRAKEIEKKKRKKERGNIEQEEGCSQFFKKKQV